MKKSGILLLLIATLAGAKSLPLPFIGKAWFNWMGGTGTQEYIIIKSSGQTEIGMCGTAGCGASYKGAFSDLIDINGNGKTFYTFSDTTITMLDENKNIDRSCNETGLQTDENLPCIQRLTFDYKEDKSSKKIEIDETTLNQYAYDLMGGKYFTNDMGQSLWDTKNLIKKTNSKGVKIYCLSYKNLCKTHAEVIEYFNAKTR